MNGRHADSEDEACPVCGSEEVESFLELSDMPAQDGVVYSSRKAALAAPTGDIRLAICRRCHYIGNLAFDAEKVGFAEYDYAQHHSRQYREHLDDVVAHLVGTYGLRNKTLIDIGCGEGFFLSALCKAGDNRGVGMDPSLTVPGEGGIDNNSLTLIKDVYTEKYSHYQGDLVSCRHVIDELRDPRGFLESITTALSGNADAILYLEMPDASRTFEQKLIWNVGYAKRSWFTATALGALLRLCGLDVLRTETVFGGEYLGITGRRTREPAARTPFPEESVDRLAALLGGFDQHFKGEVERWTRRIAQLRASDEQMVIWGAGMRGINFLNRLGDEAVFPKIVDINPNRQGSYLAGSGYFVDEPEVLKAFSPTRVLLSNPAYEAEIRVQLADMGVVCELERL